MYAESVSPNCWGACIFATACIVGSSSGIPGSVLASSCNSEGCPGEWLVIDRGGDSSPLHVIGLYFGMPPVRLMA